MTNEAKCPDCEGAQGSNPHCKGCVWVVTQGNVGGTDLDACDEGRLLRGLLCDALGIRGGYAAAPLSAFEAMLEAVRRAVWDLDLVTAFIDERGVELREEELMHQSLKATCERLRVAEQFALLLQREASDRQGSAASPRASGGAS